jgi:hypothetical protein
VKEDTMARRGKPPLRTPRRSNSKLELAFTVVIARLPESERVEAATDRDAFVAATKRVVARLKEGVVRQGEAATACVKSMAGANKTRRMRAYRFIAEAAVQVVCDLEDMQVIAQLDPKTFAADITAVKTAAGEAENAMTDAYDLLGLDSAELRQFLGENVLEALRRGSTAEH